MNPLDLPGPAFLAFFIAYCILVSLALRAALGLGEGGRPGGLPLDDPYQIAWLRGGTPEAVRVAMLVLVDRGLFELDDRRVRQRPADLWGRKWHPFERSVFHAAAGSTTSAHTILADPGVLAAAQDLSEQLASAGLTPDAACRARRQLLLGAALLLEIGMAVAKAMVAVERGRQNLGFLLILSIVGTLVLWAIAHRRRTRRGDAVLSDLRRLCGSLRERARTIRPGEMTADAMMLAAVFGLGALSDPAFAAVRGFFPTSTGASGSSSCSSSSCSSSSCGGGSGCGGCSS